MLQLDIPQSIAKQNAILTTTLDTILGFIQSVMAEHRYELLCTQLI